VLAGKTREFERDPIHNLLCVDLRLEPESCIYIVAALLFSIEYPTVLANHDILAEFGEVGGEVCL
jgi:hypothetical protein